MVTSFRYSRRQLLQQAAPLGAVLATVTAEAMARPDEAVSGAKANDAVVWRRPSHRDLPLAEWGPYSDHLNGISHITDAGRGLRMDFALAPAVLRRESLIPYADMDLAMQPVRADPDLGYIAWDYDLPSGVAVRLEWLALSADGGLLRASLHNRSETTWPIILNWLARLTPPANPPRTKAQNRSITATGCAPG